MNLKKKILALAIIREMLKPITYRHFKIYERFFILLVTIAIVVSKDFQV